MILDLIIVSLYCISLMLIFLFSLGQLHLTWHYMRSGKKKEENQTSLNDYPSVTVQLPLYNEKYVVERLINSVASINYPTDKLEIQVLDDSTDDSVELTKKLVEYHQKEGRNIKLIRRKNRKGYKAGALQYGLEKAEGELIAIFDADFLPNQEFLQKVVPYFQNEKVGVVQSRWGHINRDYSILTRLQAFGLDAHFTVEQSGRSAAGSFINFNGTGGVWRKSCIIDSGGWSDDTLTEDLDLSYRAQLKGWKFVFREELESPAELPVIMPAIKSQQYRWNKGAAETARKHLKKVLRSSMPVVNKVHAIFHLFNSSIFICLLLAAVLSIPMLYIKAANPSFDFLFNLGSIFLFGFFSIAWFYWIASKSLFPNNTFLYFIRHFPAFLMVSMGLSLHNAIAVLKGLLGQKTPFIRTPKFNIKSKKDRWQENNYVKTKINFMIVFEGILFFYFVFGVISAFTLNDWGLILFHIMLAIGFALVFIYSIKALRNA